jgi:hypothetical protein
MIDPIGKIGEGKDAIGKIQNFVAGFLGYHDRDRRREADKLLRDAVAARYEAEWGRLSDVQARLVSAKQLERLDEVEGAAIKLRTFIDRVKGAPRGYAGFFDAVRVKKEELQQLYDYDLGLLESSEKVRAAVDRLAGAVGQEDGLSEAIRNLAEVAAESARLYEKRSEVILSK